MKKIRTTITTGVASIGLVVGMAGFAGAMEGTINTTGPDSTNKIENEWEGKVRVENDNDLKVDNDNDQYARSGKAKVRGNTTGGNARTGNASNANTVKTSVSVTNAGAGSFKAPSAGGSGSIKNTGPDSYNKVENKTKWEVKVENDNEVRVYNDNDQTAKSGDARVSGNTTGGSATSGNASNSNNTSTTVSIKN